MNLPLHNAARVCFFAHFDSEGHVEDYVIRYLRKLRQLDFTIIFITPSAIDKHAKDLLLQICHDVITRRNEGLDFGSWATAFAKYGDQLAGDLLLANDSVYGPIGDLHNALDVLMSNDADFYGWVESLDVAKHLQSWFMVFKPHVHRSQAFRSVMALPFSRLTKREIIERAEVGLTTALVQAGFRCCAAYRASEAGTLSKLHSFNPSHFLWRELVTSGRVPFIKVELLRDNPLNVPDVYAWQPVVSQIEPEIVPLMRNHLVKKKAISLQPRDVSRTQRLKDWLHTQPFFARDYLYTLDNRTAAIVSNTVVFFALASARRTISGVLKTLVRSGLRRQRVR
jgi:lipopolysaccharide biosynthesis protein